VGAYFLDSSALVKRYVAESGTPWVIGITDPASGNNLFLAPITGVEVVAAMARRQPPIPPATLTSLIALFTTDFFHQYQRLAMTDLVVSRGMQLAEQHRLRGYDAVQLAAALELNTVRVASGLPMITVVSADLALNLAATAEGLTVDNPNLYP
jgi:predicted nucleic acid-binding protein